VAVDDNDGSLISGAIFSFQPLGKRDLWFLKLLRLYERIRWFAFAYMYHWIVGEANFCKHPFFLLVPSNPIHLFIEHLLKEKRGVVW
jgi:hypothetical protein